MKVTKDEIKGMLQQDGWHIEQGRHSRMAFVAWKPMKDVPNCKANDKPPCLSIEYYSSIEGDLAWESCEICVAGDTGSDLWVNLKAYSISPDELIVKLPQAIKTLTACWVAACQS